MTELQTACPGCEWDGYDHSHIDAEDGPRATCCAHTCGRPDTFPTARLAADARGDVRVVVQAGATDDRDLCDCGHDGYDGHDMRSVPPACLSCDCGHLVRGARVRVRMAGRRRDRLAVLTGDPTVVPTDYGDRTVVRFAYVTRNADQVGSETLSGRDHVAVLGADSVEVER